MTQEKHLTENQLRQYLSGKMDYVEMHKVERHVVECALCNDALEGYKTLGNSAIKSSDLKELNERLSQKLAQGRKRSKIAFLPMAIAASILLIGFVSIFLFIKTTTSRNEHTIVKKEIPQSDKFENTFENEAAPDSQDKKESVEPSDEINTLSRANQKLIFENKEEQPKQTKNAFAVKESKELELTDSNEFIASNTTSELNVPSFTLPETETKVSPKNEVNDETTYSSSKQFPESTARKSQNFLSGKVTGEDGEGLPGASVVIKGTSIQTVTDAEGNYRIPLPSSGETLQINSIGYNLLEETINKNQTTLDAKLSPDITSLTEVVIVGYSNEAGSIAGNSKIVKAKPAQGLRKFKEYIKENTRYPSSMEQRDIKGKVVVEFNVNKEGKLSDFKIKKSLGAAFDEEAVRLLKEGPGWIAGSLDGKPISQQVSVKISFTGK